MTPTLHSLLAHLVAVNTSCFRCLVPAHPQLQIWLDDGCRGAGSKYEVERSSLTHMYTTFISTFLFAQWKRFFLAEARQTNYLKQKLISSWCWSSNVSGKWSQNSALRWPAGGDTDGLYEDPSIVYWSNIFHRWRNLLKIIQNMVWDHTLIIVPPFWSLSKWDTLKDLRAQWWFYNGPMTD